MPDEKGTRSADVVVARRRDGSKELAVQGWGWPHHEETMKGNQSFIEEMQRLKDRIDLENLDRGETVATFAVRKRDGVITSVNEHARC